METAAFFLDFDGTLVEIASHPERIRLDEATRAVIAEVHKAAGGALAIVTGRDIAVIDRFLRPLHLPVAGVHGLTRRDAGGRLFAPQSAAAFLDAAEPRLGALACANEGLLVERKSASIALHYRARPELEAVCIATVEASARGWDDIEIKRGKMVVEAKTGRADKGTAVRDFMAEPPFKGRQPVFAGDDVTDEDAFRVVNELGGLSIKVGEGETLASYRVASTAAFLGWLAGVASRSACAERSAT